MNSYVEYENRTRWNGIGPLPPNDPRITEELVASHNLPDHSMFIEGYNVVVFTCDECVKTGGEGEHRIRYSIRQVLEEARASVGYVRFVADKTGIFDVYCTVYCGFGHPYQRVKGAHGIYRFSGSCHALRIATVCWYRIQNWGSYGCRYRVDIRKAVGEISQRGLRGDRQIV
jgi:hypothetical protein